MTIEDRLIKKIFICEFITAGGFNHAHLPENLLIEAALMRDALLDDLSLLDYDITLTLDSRLLPPKACDHCVVIQPNEDVWTVWETQIQLADAVWIIAPETNNYLKKLTALVAKYNVIALGCGPNAIDQFSSKLATYLICKQAGINAIPTYTLDNVPNLIGQCLAKPDDGAGCDDTFYFETLNDLQIWIAQNNKQHSHVIQPYIAGISASISCVVHHGEAIVLSCNEQLIAFSQNKLYFKGLVLNAMQAYWDQLNALTQQVAKLMPDLQGFIGIDVIIDHDDIILNEINPRVTTAYVGLRVATGVNIAELVITKLTKAHCITPKIERNLVNIHV